MQFTRFIVGACFLIINSTTALDWSVRSLAETASRDDPQLGAFEPGVLASVKSYEVAKLLAMYSSQDVQLPLPDGTLHTFRIHPSSIMAPELVAVNQNIRAFEGESVPSTDLHSEIGLKLKNEKISVLLSVSKTTVGGTAMHAQYVSNRRGYMQLEPSKLSSPTDVVLNFHVASRNTVEASADFECHAEDESKRKLLEDILISSHMNLIQDNRRKLQENGCNVETLGNFQCDPNNNRKECNFDAGDCCGGFNERFAECTPNDDVTSCSCKDDNYLTVTPRTLRLAVAANVEFSAYYNSDADAVMAQIVHTFTRVSGLFRREVGIGLEIVHTHIETNPNTRVLGHGDTWSVAQQLPGLFDDAIGNDAYDIGHCLIGAVGGVAGDIGVACNPATKAMGVTGRGKFEGDVSKLVDAVVHEMGHQLGSHHIFSGCDGNPGTPGFRVEPGGGTTYMSYAGICGLDDIQKSPSQYFHTLSLESIRRYMSNPAGGASCGFIHDESPMDRPLVETQISLMKPTVRNCAIPPSTAFRLNAVGAPITDGYFYSWEQVDNTQDSDSNGLDDTPPADGALFRSIPPKQNDASRTFPSLDLLFGRTPEAYHERLPNTPRETEFVLGVRKEYIAIDAINSTSFNLTNYSTFYIGESVKVTVADVAPLQVTSVEFAANQPEDHDEITFDVTWTGGNLASNVRIVAADGNVPSPDFAILLGSELNNNGKAQITASKADICYTAPGSQVVLYVKVESDDYLDGCSYFAIAPSLVNVDCSDTLPATIAPTSSNLFEVEFTYGPQDVNFTENGLESIVLYENNHLYKYSISGQPGMKVFLEFTELDIEENYDFLNVYDGETDEAPLILRHTGQGNGRTVLSSGNNLYMTLVTDKVIPAHGFVVRYESVDEFFTPMPSLAPTASPVEHIEIVSHESDAISYNFSPETITIISIYSSSASRAVLLTFDTPTFNFNGTISQIAKDGTTHFVTPNTTVFDLEVFAGYFVIEIGNSNEFPVHISFTVASRNEGKFKPLDFVVDLSRQDSQVGVGIIDTVKDGFGKGAEFLRGVATFTESPVRFAPWEMRSRAAVCYLSRGDLRNPAYSYVDNVIAIIVHTWNVDSLESVNDRFPFDLGNLTQVPIVVFSEGDFDPLGMKIDELIVSFTCGSISSEIQFNEFRFVLDPLLSNTPFTGSGTITAQNNEAFKYTRLEITSTLSGFMIQSTNGEPITLQFVDPPDVNFKTTVSSTSLTATVFGTSLSTTQTFGGDSGTPYPVQPLAFNETEFVTVVFEHATESPPTSIPNAFEISYSVGGITATVFEELSNDIIVDQVNKVEIDVSKPTSFKFRNHQFPTEDHTLNERWEFVAPEGYELKITFSVLDLEESADYVHLYAGTQVTNASRVQSLSGSYVPPAIVVQTNALVLRVVCDSSDDRPYRGVQGFVEVVKQDNLLNLYVIGALGGFVVVVAVALLVKKSRGVSSASVEQNEEAKVASVIELMESNKRESNGSGLLDANPLFDANDI